MFGREIPVKENFRGRVGVCWAWKEDHLNDRLNQGRQSRWKVSYQLKLEREINGKQCSMAAVWQGRVPTEQKKLACSIGAQS